jgi:hypothetical protein
VITPSDTDDKGVIAKSFIILKLREAKSESHLQTDIFLKKNGLCGSEKSRLKFFGILRRLDW